MAKAKKKESTLTLEEKLAQALVPESEQPYKVPKNWCWTYALSVFTVEYGKGLSSKQLMQNGYPVFGANGVIGCFDDYMYETPVALMSCRGAYSGKMNLSLPYSYVTSNSLIIGDKLRKFEPKFIYYLFTALNTEKLISGSAQPQVTVQAFSEYEIPLPPIAEQHRIVERVESLFAKLDEAKEKLQEVLDSFETRKAAILHKAFTGELTAKWREEHGVSLDSWEKKKLGECGVLERGKSKHRPRNDERLFGGRYPFIQTGDIASADVYVTEHKQTLSDFGLQQSKLFTVGTLCITIAANIGDVAILSYDCCFPDSVVGFTPNEDVSSKFIYYMMSVLQKEIEDNAPATAQKNINLKILNDILVIKPSVEEQNIIVNMVDEFFEKEKTIKECTLNCLGYVDEMKKAILARAFRGELGTNDENDECAVELLKRVIVEQEPKITRTNSTMSKKFAVGKLTAMEKRVFNFIVSKEEQSANVGEIFKLSKDGFKILDALRSLVEKEFLHMVSEDEYVIKE